YTHTRPLLDALEQGFCNVEADIYLVRDQLLVGHNLTDLQPERTLDRLYLQPLHHRVQANGGRVYPQGPEFTLMIDFKSSAEPTYLASVKVLEPFHGMLSSVRNGNVD